MIGKSPSFKELPPGCKNNWARVQYYILQMFAFRSPWWRPYHSSGNTKYKSLAHRTILVAKGKTSDIASTTHNIINKITFVIENEFMPSSMLKTQPHLQFWVQGSSNSRDTIMPVNPPVHGIAPVIALQPKMAIRHQKVGNFVPEKTCILYTLFYDGRKTHNCSWN